MLKHLLIKNYALIQHLEINPSTCLNIITGETGAGKSIMLGAVGLLLGNRADTRSLFNEEAKCVIEGHFDISNYGLQSLFESEELDYAAVSIFRREISPTGKSRAFVNDTPVTLDVLKKMGTRLVDVHSQHETLHLGKQNYQLAFVDAYAGTTHLRREYKKVYDEYKQTEKQLEQLTSESRQIGKESDYNNFLLDELVKAALREDEQAELEASLEVMEHAEEIKSKLNESLTALSFGEFSSIDGLQQVKILLGQLRKFSSSFEELSARIESVFIEVQDIVRELEREEEQVEFNPEVTRQTQERLSMIYQLQQKHQVQDIKSLLDIQSQLEEAANRFNNMDEEISKAADQVKALKETAQAKADELSQKRLGIFEGLEAELITLLAQVGINEATVKIDREETLLTDKGIDKISILFSANKGIPPQELSKVASGGEFSRFMFCVKFILAEKIAMPSIIFDEIDTGVSGEIAMKLGNMMQKMAKKHQVITISHLPQVAAKGDRHYFVFKDTASSKTVSKIKMLNEDERVAEIAKMIGGDKPSATAFENARELIG